MGWGLLTDGAHKRKHAPRMTISEVMTPSFFFRCSPPLFQFQFQKMLHRLCGSFLQISVLQLTQLYPLS